MAGVTSLAAAYNPTLDDSKSAVRLVRLTDDDKIDWATERTFQYFPDSLQDTKAVTWTPKDIPGGSLPLYQWTASGERSVGFTAQFTSDVDLLALPAYTRARSWVDMPADKYQDRRNVDIRSAVAWLRSFMLPRYSTDTVSTGGTLTRAPSKALLTLYNSGIGLAGGDAPDSFGPDSFVCVMSECSVEWQAFFPSGMPRIVNVSLAFLQIAQVGGGVSFPSASDDMLAAATGEGTSKYPFLGYRIVS